MDVDTLTVLRALKKNGHHKQTLRLLASKHTKQIIFSSNAFYFIDKKGCHHILSGLLPVLKRNFWPNTDINSIMRKPSKKGITKGKRGTTQEKKKVNTTTVGKGRFFGSIQGTRIHAELEDFILLDDKNFKKKHPALHPWTKRILEYVICQMKWFPIQCEYPVFDEDLRMATKMDLMCVDPATGELRFIELKTGYKATFENSDGRMSKCLRFMPNSPLNWANIQLTATVIMLLRQIPSINIDQTQSFVIRIDDDDIYAYHIDNVFIKAMNPRLLNNIDMNKAAR